MENSLQQEILHINSVKHIEKFKLWVAFDDGTEGQVDLAGYLSGSVFEPLKDESFFSKVYIDEELETVAWPNGADLAPEFVKDLQQCQC